MPVTVKTEREIDLMRESGRRLSQVHEAMHEILRPGISTKELDDCAEEWISRLGGIPNFKNEGFPAAVCVSVNDEVVHGIPSRERILEEGDIVSVDTGLVWKGYHSDAARTWGVGTISRAAQSLIDVTRESFFAGIECAKAGHHLYEISAAVGDYALSRGYGVAEDLAGHGIGTHLHEAPRIPNVRQKGRGVLVVPGMTFAIEPMITVGSGEIMWSDDGWTVKTADGKLAAHYENTIVITEGEPEILTI